mmetsp:Transcript_22797/g.28635  ORF Transcript_22797/g.28635 Transcript_22797/m.28635 type:complete len:86 (+) Transcript_22797:6752-7009(+)
MSRLELWIECLFQQCLPFFLILKQIILILMHMKLLPMNASTLCLGHQGLSMLEKKNNNPVSSIKNGNRSLSTCVCVCSCSINNNN